MIINDLDGYYIVFDTKNWNTELDTLFINFIYYFFPFFRRVSCNNCKNWNAKNKK